MKINLYIYDKGNDYYCNRNINNKAAMVTSGGVSVKDINSSTLESKIS